MTIMKKWYVLQVYAGYEDVIKRDLEKRLAVEGLGDFFDNVVVPSAKAKAFFDQVEEKDQQLFPGYMLIEMELSPETFRFVMKTPKVIKFLGGKEPAVLSQKEVDRIFSQIRGERALPVEKSEFNIGSEIDIKDGPFAGFVGIIEKVDDENERLTVMVSIFGRLTPVEIGFDQIKC